MQAQDLRSARLAIRARTRGLTAADVDRQLNDGIVVVGWLNRGTLHLVGRDDYWWLHRLTTPPLFTGNARRLAQTGVTPGAAERGVAAIEHALEREGPLTRVQLRNRLEAARVPTAGQALVHLLMLACLRGVAVRGPIVGGQHAYVSTRDWLDPPSPIDRDRALGELASRYLAGHAPASDRDLAKWAGLPLRDARRGLSAIAPASSGRARGGAPRPCLLDQWDPVLVGWHSRDRLLAHYPGLESPETHYRPFAYVSAQAVAVWSLRGGQVELGEPFAAVDGPALNALRADAVDVGRFLRRDNPAPSPG